MNCKTIFLIFTIFILIGCNQYENNRSLDYSLKEKYKNSGFTLIYDSKLKNNKKISKKIDNRSLFIFHKKIKKNSF